MILKHNLGDISTIKPQTILPFPSCTRIRLQRNHTGSKCSTSRAIWFKPWYPKSRTGSTTCTWEILRYQKQLKHSDLKYHKSQHTVG